MVQLKEYQLNTRNEPIIHGCPCPAHVYDSTAYKKGFNKMLNI